MAICYKSTEMGRNSLHVTFRSKFIKCTILVNFNVLTKSMQALLVHPSFTDNMLVHWGFRLVSQYGMALWYGVWFTFYSLIYLHIFVDSKCSPTY